MDFSNLFVIAGLAVAIFVLIVWLKTRSANRMTRLRIGEWRQAYATSSGYQKHGIARALLEQSLHLAHHTGALSVSDFAMLQPALRKQNPIALVDEWFLVAYYNVIEAMGSDEVAKCEARLVGALMIVSMVGVNPVADVRRFLTRLGGG